MKTKLFNTVNHLLTLYSILVLAISLIVTIFPQTFYSTLIRSLAPQICFVSFAVLIYQLFKNNTYLFVSNFIAFILLFTVFNEYIFTQKNTLKNIQKSTISFAQFNILKSNKNHQKVVKTILDTDANIVSIQEIDSKWAKNIHQQLVKKYPYHITKPSEICCFGIALYSKFPLQDIKIKHFGNAPNIVADVLVNGEKIHIVSAHTHAPIYKERFNLRNQHLVDIQKYLQNIHYTKIVLGDFNSVPWDNYLIQFKNKSNLIDSRQTYTATFPSFLGKFGIPIDYIFHSPNIHCLSTQVIKIKSSDHNGIKSNFQINQSSIVKN
jgi:endonuclease/exonuclease/phosphatase (EEP) superfamily protein YafD